MEDNSQTEQVVDIINLIETTLPATSVPETTTEATILNLPFTEGVVLIGALVILIYRREHIMSETPPRLFNNACWSLGEATTTNEIY
ncbi:Dynein heavy chain,cytoplasmic [Trichinella pseudospiralis]